MAGRLAGKPPRKVDATHGESNISSSRTPRFVHMFFVIYVFSGLNKFICSFESGGFEES